MFIEKVYLDFIIQYRFINSTVGFVGYGDYSI